MADSFPPSEPELGDTCEEEDMEEDLTVQLGSTYSCRRADGTYVEAEVVKMRTNPRTKALEYMVRYVGLTRRQTEWVDKSRLVLLEPQEDEVLEEGTEQEMSESGHIPQNEDPDEDEPETKKPRVDENESPATISLMVPGEIAEELTCLLCSKLYDDPVMVECGHNFCRRCVDKTWEDQGFFTCPDCKEVQTEKSYCTNRTLGKLVKKAAGFEPPTIPFKNCDDHEEQVLFYCKDDGVLGCIICQDSLKHTNHTFQPILEAVEIYRAQLSEAINPLEEALKKADEKVVQYKKQFEEHQSKLPEKRQHIVTEFGKLYSYLKERKESLLEQLRTQGQEVLKDMKADATKLAQSRDNLKQSIADAGEKAADTNSYSFLADIKPVLKKLTEQRKASISTRRSLSGKQLSHGTFNGPLQYIMWRQMKPLVAPAKKVAPPKTGDGDQQKAAPKADRSTSADEAKKVAPPKTSDGDQQKAAPKADRSTSADEECTERTEVWVVGESIIPHRVDGDNLSIPKYVCNIRYLNHVKTWSSLLPKLETTLSRTGVNPHIIVLHLGSMDLAHSSIDSLNTSVQKILTSICSLFPKVTLILSTLLPRREWLGSLVEDNRKLFNINLCKFAGRRYFTMLKHKDLETALLERLKRGGESRLIDKENDMLMKSFREALLKRMKGRIKFLESHPELKIIKETEPEKAAQPPSSAVGINRNTLYSEESLPIWIVGDSYIYKAFGHVGKRPFGPHLGLDKHNWNLRWLGRINHWHKLAPELEKSVTGKGKPKVIFLHLGSDDLQQTSYEGLVDDMRGSLYKLGKIFPSVKVVLSALLPKAEWMGSHLDEWRKMFNTRLERYAERHRLHMVKFNYLEQRLSARFRKDGNSHLTVDENDSFVTVIRDSLRKLFKEEDPAAAANIPKEMKPSVEKEQKTTEIEPAVESPSQNLILIIGDTTVSKAASFMKKSSCLPNFGLEEKTWGLRWLININKIDSVVPTLMRYRDMQVRVILIHTGGNDLGSTAFSNFFYSLRHTANRAAKIFPKSQIILSGLLPKAEWLNEESAPKLEQNRKRANEELAAFATKEGFQFVGHEAVNKNLLARVKAGNSSSELPDEDLEAFLKDINDALHEAVAKGDQQPVEKLPQQSNDEEKPDQPSELEQDEEEEEVFEEPPIDPDNLPERDIWLLGSPHIQELRTHAMSSLGQNLGFENRNWTLHWHVDTMEWGSLLADLHFMSKDRKPPGLILIHLGDHDLGKMRLKKLVNDVRYYLGLLAKDFPNTQFVFVPVLPQASWKGRYDVGIEDCCVKFNATIGAYATRCGFVVASLKKLEKMRLARFKTGDQKGTLTPDELEEFLKAIRISLLKGMLRDPSTAPGARFLSYSPQEPPKVKLSSGALFYFIPEMEKKRGIETFFKFPKDKLAGKKSPEQDDSDQSDSDSDEDNPFEEMEQDLQKECDPKNGAGAEKTTVDSEKPVEDQSGQKQVWILGSSFFSRAKLFAESKPHWRNLGLDEQNVTVHWFGSTGMRWETFGQEVEKAREAYGIPDIVIVHLGGNDMGRIPYKRFFKAVKYDFRRFGILFRKTHLIYSTILPRTEWLMTPVEQVRVMFNKSIAKCRWSLGFHVLTHTDIEDQVIARFKTGRSNDLSDVEYHQLLVGIRDSVKMVLNM